MNADDSLRIALGMKGAVEGGMVKLTPEQQQQFVLDAPAAFAPENGAWGRQGCTKVQLDAVDEETLGEALTLAFQNAAPAGRVRVRGRDRDTRRRAERGAR